MTAVPDAITEAMQAANPGCVVTGWALTIQATTPGDPDAAGFTHVTADGQPVSTTLGLLDIARRHHLERIGDAG